MKRKMIEKKTEPQVKDEDEITKSREFVAPLSMEAPPLLLCDVVLSIKDYVSKKELYFINDSLRLAVPPELENSFPILDDLFRRDSVPKIEQILHSPEDDCNEDDKTITKSYHLENVDVREDLIKEGKVMFNAFGEAQVYHFFLVLLVSIC
jgi:hypothetical protein